MTAARTPGTTDPLALYREKVEEENKKRLADYGERIMSALRDGTDRLESVSHYEIVKELGEGGMGTVFLAEHVSEHDIRKPVAVKVLKDTYDEDAMKAFVGEARLLARLAQGTIVELLALESKELTIPGVKNPRTGMCAPAKRSKIYFMVQEYVNGPGFDRVLSAHRHKGLLMAPAMVGFVLNKTALALAEAHTLCDDRGANLNLVHRDISPSNILIMKRAGITKLADFGVARAFAETGGDGSHVVGKPRYMAPEQLDGFPEQVSDIWSLGVIGYEALTGYPPYRVIGETLREQARNLREQYTYPLRSPAEVLAVDPMEHFDVLVLSDIIMACLAQGPDERPTATAMSGRLEGEFLYAKGLGPTNKTLAAYLELLDCAVGEGEIIPPQGYAATAEARTICATLRTDTPVSVFRHRAVKTYRKEFLAALKAKVTNPCLKERAGADGAASVFAPQTAG